MNFIAFSNSIPSLFRGVWTALGQSCKRLFSRPCLHQLTHEIISFCLIQFELLMYLPLAQLELISLAECFSFDDLQIVGGIRFCFFWPPYRVWRALQLAVYHGHVFVSRHCTSAMRVRVTYWPADLNNQTLDFFPNTHSCQLSCCHCAHNQNEPWDGCNFQRNFPPFQRQRRLKLWQQQVESKRLKKGTTIFQKRLYRGLHFWQLRI